MKNFKKLIYSKKVKNRNFLKRFFKSIYKKIILISHKLIIEINEINYPTKSRYADLIKSYEDSGMSIDRESHIKRLNICLDSLNLPKYNEIEGMYSEHLVIFAAISTSSFKPKKILEIGTYDGKTALILSSLFPNSEITTIDLKDNDRLFNETYNRKTKAKIFSKKRDSILSKQNNIRFMQCNSLELTFKKDIPKQDLIWVDGAHGYPTVTIDITNSIKLLKKNGILMCDDVWKDLNKNDKIYKSIASYETLNAFSGLEMIKTIFFRKRISKNFNRNSQFIGFSKIN